MGIRLTVQSHWSEDGSEHVFEFDQERVVLGRAGGADVCLPHQAVSAHHATIRVQGAGYVLEDEGSTNGTSVNDTRLAPKRAKPLRTDDRIELGGFSIRFSGGIPVAYATSVEGTAELARQLVREVLSGREDVPTAPRIFIESGPGEGKAVELSRVPMRITAGRGAECELVLDDEDASREHLEISRDLSGVLVRDLQSKNGVTVNERPTQERRLRHGDAVGVGDTILRFEDEAEAAVRARASMPDVAMQTPTAPLAERAREPANETQTADKPEPQEQPTAKTKSTRSGIEADVVIYLLAAAVLAISIAGLFILLRSG